MSDDKTKTRPQDAKRINVHEEYELRDWSKKFGVSAEQLKQAVKEVGTSADAVEKHLKGKNRGGCASFGRHVDLSESPGVDGAPNNSRAIRCALYGGLVVPLDADSNSVTPLSGAGGAQFNTTHWSVVLTAGRKDVPKLPMRWRDSAGLIGIRSMRMFGGGGAMDPRTHKI